MKAKPSLAGMSEMLSVRSTKEGPSGVTLPASQQAGMPTSHPGAPAPEALPPVKELPPSWSLPQVAVRMSKEKKRRLRQVAAGYDMTVQDLIMEALDEYLDKRGLRRID